MKFALEGDMGPLLAGLKGMEKGADERACMKALRAGGRVLAEAMKARIRRRSNRTADSIKVRKARSGGDTFGVVVGASGDRAHVGRLLEAGHTTPGGKHVPAYPWARPSWDSTQNGVRETVFATLFAEISAAKGNR